MFEDPKQVQDFNRRFIKALKSIAQSLVLLAKDVHLIREKYCPLPSDVTYISVKENVAMPKTKCTFVPFSGAKRAAVKGGKTADGSFQLLDNGDGTFTTTGVNEAGQGGIDISTVATETVVSDNPSLVVGPITGMTVKLTAPATDGTANVTWTATWNDGSIGPFPFVGVVTWSGGKVIGIKVVQS